jgi:pimeloyl-ACP methyl ester carboxylesterase
MPRAQTRPGPAWPPAEVAGLVLVDASTEANFTVEGAEASNAAALADIDGRLKGSTPALPVIPIPAGTNPQVALAFTPEVLRGVREEYLALGRVPEAMRGEKGYGVLGAKPLVAIRRGLTTQPPSAADIWWRQQQEKLPLLSTNSELVVAEKAGHVITVDDPQIVADAVAHILEVVRTGGQLKAR